MLLNKSLGFDSKTGSFYFPALVFRVLPQCGNAAVSKNTWHNEISVRKGCMNHNAYPKLISLTFGQR